MKTSGTWKPADKNRGIMAEKHLHTLFLKLPYPLRVSIINLYGYILSRKRFNKTFDIYLKKFLETQWMSPEKIKELQFVRLSELLEFSYQNVPYYKKLFDKCGLKPKDIQAPSDLEKIPLLTKKIIRENFKDLLAINVRKSDIELTSSSGTTGEKLMFYLPKVLKYQINFAITYRFYSWAGVKPFDRRVTIGGRVFTKHRPYWVFNRAENQLLFSIHHLGYDTVDEYIETMKKFAPVFIQGHPSGVAFVAKRLKEIGKTIPVKAIFTTGESLFDDQRKMMEEGFSCRVFDTWGLGESAASANECELHAGYHEDSEYGLIEFVETEKGYEVVGTSLFNYAMPFIRYRIEDIVEVMPVDQQSCKCGRGLPLKIKKVTGRIDDQLTTSSGKIILPVTMRMVIKPLLLEGESYQLIQLSDNKFVFKIASPNLRQDRTQFFYDTVVGILGHDIKVDIEKVSQIEMSGGKFRNIINLAKK